MSEELLSGQGREREGEGEGEGEGEEGRLNVRPVHVHGRLLNTR